MPYSFATFAHRGLENRLAAFQAWCMSTDGNQAFFWIRKAQELSFLGPLMVSDVHSPPMLERSNFRFFLPCKFLGGITFLSTSTRSAEKNWLQIPMKIFSERAAHPPELVPKPFNNLALFVPHVSHTSAEMGGAIWFGSLRKPAWQRAWVPACSPAHSKQLWTQTDLDPPSRQTVPAAPKRYISWLLKKSLNNPKSKPSSVQSPMLFTHFPRDWAIPLFCGCLNSRAGVTECFFPEIFLIWKLSLPPKSNFL